VKPPPRRFTRPVGRSAQIGAGWTAVADTIVHSPTSAVLMTLAGFDSHDVFFSPISFLRAIFTFVDAPPGRYVVERARSRTTAASLAINETPVCMEQPAAELRLLRRPLLPVVD